MVRPKQNLDPGSQQWARAVESDVDQLLASQSRGLQTIDNTLSGLANSVSSLGNIVATLTSTVQTLTDQQNYLASLKSRDDAIGTYYNNSLIADGQWHWDPFTVSVNIAVPTGKMRVFLRTSNSISVAGTFAGGSLGTAQAGVTYSVSGGVLTAGSAISYVSAEPDNYNSAPIMRVGTITCPPGTYTVTGYRGYRCFNNNTNKYVMHDDTALIVEVVNND